MKPQPFDDEAPTLRVQARDPALAQAEAEVQRTRALVMRSAMALRDAVVQRTDWRQIVGRQPVASLAVAFAVGLWWGSRK
jgi:hypothetical protein